MPAKTLGRTVKWIAVAGWASVIFAMSSVPGSSIPGRFGSAAHFIEYAVLAMLLLAAISHDRSLRIAAILALTAASVYGVSDEFHQSFVPMRTPDPVDWMVDTAGAAFAIALCVAVVTLVRHHRNQ